MSKQLPGDAEQKGSVVGERDWARLKPLGFGRDDAMEADEVKRCWAKIYKDAGLRSPGEEIQAACRLGVYAYACANGTSKWGSYSRTVVMSNGHKFAAAVVPVATGQTEIRRFFRGNLEESYKALKESQVMQDDERYLMYASKHGVSPACAFALADWLTDCPLFTPEENRAHEQLFAYRTERARRARGGRSIEEVDGERRAESLRAQGPMSAQGDGDF